MYRMYCGPRFAGRHGWQWTVEGDTAYQPIPVDVVEKDDEYWIRLSMPGFKTEDIQIDVDGDGVRIRAERKDTETEGTPLLQERYLGKVGRSLSLPTELDSEKTEASLEDGVLTIKVVKAEKIRSKSIPVTKK
jgi:HSP20 family protein